MGLLFSHILRQAQLLGVWLTRRVATRAVPPQDLYAVSAFPGQGRGLVATQPIPQGTEVLREGPIACVPATHARGKVCHGCLAPLGPLPFQHSVSGAPFCTQACLEVSSRRYHDVEALSDLQPLQQHCDTHGVRFPMLAARIACTTLGLAAAEEARIIAERYGVQAEPAPATTTTTTATTVTTTSGSVPVVQQQGDPESALRLLTFARITPPYPEPWLLEAKLLQAALRPAARTLASRLVDTETQLRNTAQAQGTVQASSAQAGGTQTDTSTQPQGTDGTAGPTTATPAAATATPATAATVTPATAEDDWDADIERDTLSEDLIAGLDADWYAGVQARIAVNVFRVDTVLPPSMTTTITTAHEGACVGVGVGQGQGQDGGVPGERQDAAAELARLAAEMVRAESGAAGDGARGTGSAMFLLSSFLNHSCVPNLEVQWPLNNAVVAFRASRGISPGEQLFISYIDTEAPVSERQEALWWNYGFKCACERCVEELRELSGTHIEPAGPEPV